MLSLAQTLSFLLAAGLITLSPGPDNLMVLSFGISKGRREGVAFGLGCAVGCLSHTALAVLGVSALLVASPVAFTVLKWVGGGYLVWLGWQAWRHAGAVTVQANAAPHNPSIKQLFFKGMMANAVNPKVVIFFLSFLPQFVDVQAGAAAWQLGQLGVLFTLQAMLIFGSLGWFAGHIGGWLNRRPNAGFFLDRLAGTVFVVLGLRIIFSRS
jgi:threonine/homoserine/homoserine lactone efflux protein